MLNDPKEIDDKLEDANGCFANYNRAVSHLAAEARRCQETLRTEALMQRWLACPYSVTNLYSDARVRFALVDPAAERSSEHRRASVNWRYWHHDRRLGRQTLAAFIFSQHLQSVLARLVVVNTRLGFGFFASLHCDSTRPPVNMKSRHMKYKAQTVNHPPERLCAGPFLPRWWFLCNLAE